MKIWLLQNAIAFRGIKVQIVPYHFVSKQILGAHPFCRLFSMPPILCLEKGGSDPMGLISTGVIRCFSDQRISENSTYPTHKC